MASGAKARMEIPIPKRVQKKVEAGSRRDQGVLSDLRKLELEVAEEAAKPEAIKGAAIRVGDRTFVGRSHFDAYEQASAELGEAAVDKALGARPRDFEGFVTTKGRFINRKEAVGVADKAKQLDKEVSRGAEKEMGIEDMSLEAFTRMAKDINK